jgi:hypothetical protein
MKIILPLFALSLLLAVPCHAQEEGKPVSADEELAGGQSIPAANLELAKQMHEIWPIRTRIESAINAVAENFPPEKKVQAKAAIRKSIQFDQVEEESIKAMASTFTEEELKAMIAFYGSETGRSISAKTTDYELAMRPVIVKMMDKAMLDLKTGMTP